MAVSETDLGPEDPAAAVAAEPPGQVTQSAPEPPEPAEAAAAAGRAPASALTGLLAGLLFATAPYMTYYAQLARSYALETMFATIATYLLVRAWPDGRWRWWLGYGTAVALTGLLNIFGLLIL